MQSRCQMLNVDANTEGYTPWVSPPLLTTYSVDDNYKDYCQGEIFK